MDGSEGNVITNNYIGIGSDNLLVIPNAFGNFGYADGSSSRNNTVVPNKINYVVKSSADSGAGTLRQAMLDANAGNGGVITFSFKDSDGNSIPTTITLSSSLPEITQPVVIDGYANGMGVENSLDIGNNAQLNVTIKGYSTGDSVKGKGFVIGCSECTIKGLVLGNCYYAIELKTDISDIAITGNFIGVDRSGKTEFSNSIGIAGNGCSNITVAGNVISGSYTYGVLMSSVDYCVFSNNMVGVNALGDKAVGSVISGMGILGGSNLEIRDSVLSGNAYKAQLDLEQVMDLYIHGCKIGTDAYGVRSIKSDVPGVYTFGLVASECSKVSIFGCVVSGNISDGLYVNQLEDVHIDECFIGTDAAGLYSIANGGYGIDIWNSKNLEIKSCVLSGSGASGLSLIFSNGVTVQDCMIGTDSTGMYALPNGDGIYIGDSSGCMIGGGDNYGHRNVISGNRYYGVCFAGSSTVDNEVTHNYLGISADGSASLPNKQGNFGAQNSASVSKNITSPNKTTPS